ncbi:hypothetical protein [Streptomyces sp. NPDC002851]
MLGGPAPDPNDPEAQRDFSWGQRHAREDLKTPDGDPRKLFIKACLHGLRARLCDDMDGIDRYLPAHVASLARKVVEVLMMPQPATP